MLQVLSMPTAHQGRLRAQIVIIDRLLHILDKEAFVVIIPSTKT